MASRLTLFIQISAVLFVCFFFIKDYKLFWNDEKPEFLADFEEFMNDWCRVRQARTDLEAVLGSCRDQIKWDYRRSGTSTNATMSFISSWDLKPAGQFSRIYIQAVRQDGKEARSGGDWWRVFIRGVVSIRPTVFDLGNGTYEVIFLIVEPGIYSVEIVLDYSLCDGFRDPPEDWFIIGNAQGKMQPQGTLRGRAKEDFRLEPFQGGRNLKINIRLPNAKGLYLFNGAPNKYLAQMAKNSDFRCGKCKFIWDGYGRWAGEIWKSFLIARHPGQGDRIVADKQANEALYNTLWIYGDSQAERMYHEILNTTLCQSIFKLCKLSRNWVYTYTVEFPPQDDLDFDYGKIIKDIKQVLASQEMTYNSIIVLNLGLHYLQSTNFSNYVKLLHNVVALFKKSESSGRRPVRMIWKTSTPISKEKDIKEYLYSDFKRFLNNARVAMFNAYATALMCHEGFEVLDVHPLTGSYPHGTGGPGVAFYKEHDIVHYKHHVMSPFQKSLAEYLKGNLPKHLTIENYQFS